jgi:hypothetical protein
MEIRTCRLYQRLSLSLWRHWGRAPWLIQKSSRRSRKPYQLTLIAPCTPNEFCELNFPVLTDKVLVKHVSCIFAGTNIGTVAVISRNSDSSTSGIEYQQPFVVPGSSGSGNPVYSFNSQAYLFADKGGVFAISVSGSPTDVMQCTVSGDYI